MNKRIKNILRCYAAGMGIKETASTFHTSRNTVRKYVRLFLSSGKSIYQLLSLSEEGFCWIDVNSTYLKARIKDKGVFDVLSMSLFTMTEIPDWYYVSLINSEFISLYVDNFINNTSHFQINDARQLPVIIPTQEELSDFQNISQKSIDSKKSKSLSPINSAMEEKKRKFFNLY